MNTIQKRILIAGAVLFVVAALYVPWNKSYHRYDNLVVVPAGYRLLFNPPQEANGFSIQANWPQVLMTMLVIAVVAGVAIYLTKDYVPRSQPAPSDAIQDLSGRDLSIRK